MFLSRIELDEQKRETMRALETPSVMHGIVENSIGGERKRSLWRVDRLGGKCYLLVLSGCKPVLSRIAEQLCRPEEKGEVKDYDRLIERIVEGQRWRFRLRANPIHSAKPTENGQRGKVHAHVTVEQQKQWLVSRAARCGFSAEKDEFDVVDARWFRFFKHQGAKEQITIRTATFEGILTVTDADLFKAALTNGIGKAKAYGCGLITVMRE